MLVRYPEGTRGIMKASLPGGHKGNHEGESPGYPEDTRGIMKASLQAGPVKDRSAYALPGGHKGNHKGESPGWTSDGVAKSGRVSLCLCGIQRT